MIEAHVSAVRNLVDAVPNVTIYDGTVPNDPAYPYVVLYADQGAAFANAYTEVSTFRTFRVQTTTVAANQPQARALAERVESALLDVRPTVTGRKCAPIRTETAQPVRRADDVDPVVFYAVDIWALSSVPA